MSYSDSQEDMKYGSFRSPREELVIETLVKRHKYLSDKRDHLTETFPCGDTQLHVNLHHSMSKPEDAEVISLEYIPVREIVISLNSQMTRVHIQLQKLGYDFPEEQDDE